MRAVFQATSVPVPPSSSMKRIEAHLPPMHDSLVAQTLPQAPQFLASFDTLISQPSAARTLQSAKLVSQTYLHADERHAAAAFARVGQVVPQPPQFDGSNEVLTQLPEQLVRPVPQEATQVLPLQTLPDGQAVPQAPQLLRSLVRSRQTPEHAV